MSETILFGVGGIVLLVVIAAIAVYGVAYSKTRRRQQIGERFPEDDDSPGTTV